MASQSPKSRQAASTGAGAKQVAPTDAGAPIRTKSSEREAARMELAKQFVEAKRDREIASVRKIFGGLSAQDLEKKVCV